MTKESRIKYYQAKLTKLQAKLAKFQKKGATRKAAIKVIFEINRVENILVALCSAIVPFSRKKKATRTLTLSTPRRAWRAWVAEISAERDETYGGFAKSFFEPVSREFGKRRETEATFEIPIDLTAIYQDSDGDYWVFENLDGDIKNICYQEVCYRFQKQKLA